MFLILDKLFFTYGFPDNKHKKVQITATALEDVALTIVVELFHSLYLPDFTAYFSVKYDKSVMRIHSPIKFVKKFNRSTWMAFIDKKVLETSSIDLPLNLPTKMTESGASTFENKILIDSPRNTVLLQSVLQNTILKKNL